MLWMLAAAISTALMAGIAWRYADGRRRPDATGDYVAMGSSFAAGIGLGARAPDSPRVCMRTTGGYPSVLARKLGLRLVDKSCSGSTTAHILKGGPFFLRSPLAAVGPATRLVTITSGGNDVGYVRDLMAAAGNLGVVGTWLAGKPRPVDLLPFDQVRDNLVAIVEAVRRRAPDARILLVDYPVIVPDAPPFDKLNVGPETAARARAIGVRLSSATREAAERAGALFVDLGAISAGHHACSSLPWVHGAKPAGGTPFHPNHAGAEAVAQAVCLALSSEAQAR